MSERLGVADDVVGVAAVAAQGGRLVAYVLVDRVMVAAKQGGVDPMELGLVIAHEIGHLMLPANAHSVAGLMRRRWSALELRDGAPSPHFTFTDTQADLIRHRLGQGMASAVAAQQASNPASPQPPEPSASTMEIRP